jgi:acyl-CoA thioesterase I
MEYQPLRYRLSGHGLTRDYPRIHRVTRCPRVNRPVFQRHSQRLTSSVVKRESTRHLGEHVSTHFVLRTRTARTIVSIGTAMIIGLSGSARSQAQEEVSSAERCLAANMDLSLGAQLPRTAARLKSGEPLKIVAIGSSSTVGLWVLRSAATYPEVMRRELSRLRSNATIKVINSGRVGDTIPNNIARFEQDVLAHTPDLVIWQLGTNDVAWGGRPDQGLKRSVLEGVRALKAWSADVVLMDLQYAPQVLASASYSTMEDIIADVARQERVGLFSRFALMRNSINAGVAQSTLVTFDGLHNTADGYDCIGRALARAISTSAR